MRSCDFTSSGKSAEYVAAGMRAEEARRRVWMEIGEIERVKQECREARNMHLLQDLAQDVRHGMRLLRKSPGFTAVAMLTLALGIGANTAILSVVQGVLLAPLPYSQPDRLVMALQKNLKQNYDADISYPDFLDWRRTSQSFVQMAAFTPQSYDLTSPGSPEHVGGNNVSAGFFSMLGVKLALGREFSPSEDVHGGAPVAIISEQMWAIRFARSPRALGQFVTLDGVDYTVVGVFPADFQFLDTVAEVYVPVGQGDPLTQNDRTAHGFACIARLKAGVTVAQAQAEMDGVQENLNQVYPTMDRGLATTVVPLKQMLVRDVSGTLLLLLGAVGIVLLIACANVVNLLLARSAGRSRELALRVALGASRGRVMRQLLTESMLLSLAGGAVGLLAAKWGLSAVLTTMAKDLPRSSNVNMNLPVLFFALGVSMAVATLLGLAPALKGSNADPQRSLREGSRGSTRAHHRVQSGLVISQMALTLVLLTGAGLLFRTILQLWTVNPGLDPQHVITFNVGLSPSALKTPSGIRTAFQQLIERIREIPGVEAADLTSVLPLSPEDNTGPFWTGTQPPASMAEATRALYFEVGPEYLQTMGIPLLKGRFFTPEDTTASEPVIVIDDALARAYFPDKDPVGQRVTIAHWTTARIVGVVGHVKHWGLGNSSRVSQSRNLHFVLPTSGPVDAGLSRIDEGSRAYQACDRGGDARDSDCRVWSKEQSARVSHSDDAGSCFGVDGIAAAGDDFARGVCGFGAGAGVGGSLWRDLVFRGAASARDWNPNGAWRGEAGHFADGNWPGSSVGDCRARDWNGDRDCSHSIALQLFAPALWRGCG